MRKRSLWLKSGAIVVVLALFAGFGVLFDNFVRMASTQMLQITISDISKGAEVAVFDATSTLDEVVATNASICTPEFLTVVRQTLQRSVFVRQILVESKLGVRYCSGLEVEFAYSVMSEEMPIPGRNETLAAIRIFGTDTTLLRITHQVDDNRTISAFVHYAPILATGQLPGILSWGDLFRVEFTNSIELMSTGDREIFDFSEPNSSHIYATALAGDLPLKTLGSVPIEVVRAHYQDMYIGVFGVAFLFGVGGLFLVFRLVGQEKLAPMDLENALTMGHIVPYYQPIIDMTSGRMVGCEVLARWVKPKGKIIMPAAFVDYAAASGLAVPMTIGIMQRVARDLGEVAPHYRDLRISINLYCEQFDNLNIVDDVSLIFGKSKVDFSQLIFEISRRQKLNKTARKTIKGLKNLGCKLAMDDQQTNIADIEKMRIYGVDEFKIGQELVETIVNAKDEFPEIEKLVKAAQAANISLVAKGVERKEQALYLRTQGVTNLQGFLFAPAMSPERFVDMLTKMNGAQEAGPDKPVAKKSKIAAKPVAA